MSAPSHQAGSWLDAPAAAVPALAAAWSATLLGPLLGVSGALAAPIAALATFLMGWVVMRSASPRPDDFTLQVFHPPTEPDQYAGDQPLAEHSDCGVLLLDRPLGESMDALAELLLDDSLPEPSPESRVVQLFPAQPSPAELVRRIDSHLAVSERGAGPSQGPAADSLRRALDELRQTLARR